MLTFLYRTIDAKKDTLLSHVVKKIFINTNFHDDLLSFMTHALKNLEQTLKWIAIALTCDACGLKYINLQIGVNELCHVKD